MTRCTRTGVTLLLAVLLLGASAGAAQAQKMEIVLRDGLWGGAVGALLGVAQLMLLEDPEGEEHRIVTATGAGIIVGVGFGIAEASGAFASYRPRDNRLVVGAPVPRVRQTPYGRELQLTLFDTRF